MEFIEKGASSAGFGNVPLTGHDDTDKGEGEIRADTMLCETSDKRMEARFWLLVNLNKLSVSERRK